MIRKLAISFFSIFLFCSSVIQADEYETTKVAELNNYLATQYNTAQPSTAVDLVKHWQQIKHIDSLTYFYRENSALFNRTNAAPHILHKWAGVQMSFKMQNHDNPVVGVLANLIQSYKYMLRDRLNGGQSGTYSEIADLTKTAGKKLAILVDQEYADGTLIPPEKNPWL